MSTMKNSIRLLTAFGFVLFAAAVGPEPQAAAAPNPAHSKLTPGTRKVACNGGTLQVAIVLGTGVELCYDGLAGGQWAAVNEGFVTGIYPGDNYGSFISGLDCEQTTQFKPGYTYDAKDSYVCSIYVANPT
ncbi:MAG TPA: hypothetical protein VNO21_02755 [Polyangiaceae bacterium]|nr:hypothetical protein [Polyangiaceae bacterium]